MLFKGTMSLVTDIRQVGPEINDRDFVCIAAVTNTDSLLNHPNVYNAGILMPPTDILMRWADGDQLIMQNAYPNYLMYNKDADDMIVALLAALTKKNVILYIPTDEFSIFGLYLLNHLYFMYGITVNGPTTMFNFDQTKLPLIISKFYMIDIMEPDDYLISYPSTMRLPDFVINKLANDLKPFDRPATFIEYSNYFNNIVAQNNNGNKVMMIRKAD